MLLSVLAATLTTAFFCGAPITAHADFHLGPQIGFQIYHRQSPEETPSVRPSGQLSIKFDLRDSWPVLAELAGSYEAGLDQFATQDSVDDRVVRLRGGIIYKPFQFQYPFFGARLGAQYNLVYGVYNIAFPASTTDLTPHYWSPYFGAVIGMLPMGGGFGVEDELTIWYDQYFKCVVYQMSFGFDVM